MYWEPQLFPFCWLDTTMDPGGGAGVLIISFLGAPPSAFFLLISARERLPPTVLLLAAKGFWAGESFFEVREKLSRFTNFE